MQVASCYFCICVYNWSNFYFILCPCEEKKALDGSLTLNAKTTRLTKKQYADMLGVPAK